MSYASQAIANISEMGAKAQIDRERVIYVAAQKLHDMGEEAFADELIIAATTPGPFLAKHFDPLMKGPTDAR